MSTTTETATRPPRAPAASVVLTVMAIVTALLLAPVTSAGAAEPLPTGTYEVSVAAGQVTLDVTADGGVELAASDGLVVRLAFDEDGRVLDEFTVGADIATYLVEVELDDDGSYGSTISQQQTGADQSLDAGEVVSTVAECAPTGLVARAVGLPNHGTIVSTAASGLTLDAEVTDPVSGDVTELHADFSSLAGARDFCAQVDAAVPTLDEVRETLEAQAAAARAERLSAQQERAAARAALSRARAAQRAADRAAERAAERAAQRGPDDTAPPGSQQPTSGSEEGQGEQASDDTTGTTDDPSQDTTSDDTSTDTSTDDTSTGDTTTDSTTGSTTDSTTDDATTDGPGQGSGKPSDPGGKGKAPTG